MTQQPSAPAPPPPPGEAPPPPPGAPPPAPDGSQQTASSGTPGAQPGQPPSSSDVDAYARYWYEPSSFYLETIFHRDDIVQPMSLTLTAHSSNIAGLLTATTSIPRSLSNGRPSNSSNTHNTTHSMILQVVEVQLAPRFHLHLRVVLNRHHRHHPPNLLRHHLLRDGFKIYGPSATLAVQFRLVSGDLVSVSNRFYLAGFRESTHNEFGYSVW